MEDLQYVRLVGIDHGHGVRFNRRNSFETYTREDFSSCVFARAYLAPKAQAMELGRAEWCLDDKITPDRAVANIFPDLKNLDSQASGFEKVIAQHLRGEITGLDSWERVQQDDHYQLHAKNKEGLLQSIYIRHYNAITHIGLEVKEAYVETYTKESYMYPNVFYTNQHGTTQLIARYDGDAFFRPQEQNSIVCDIRCEGGSIITGAIFSNMHLGTDCMNAFLRHVREARRQEEAQ